MPASATGKGASALGEVLSGLRRDWRRGHKAVAGLELPERLASCLGPERAASVGFGGLSRGTLTLTVDSSALLGELNGFLRAAVLAAVQTAPEGGRIRDVRFVSTGRDDAR